MSDTEIGKIQIPWPDWQLEERIGRGQFGTVYKISRTQYGVTEYAAMKIISIPSDPQQIANDYSYGYDKESIAGKYKSYLDDIIKEFQLMMKLKGNTNIVRCDDVSIAPHNDGIGWDVFIRMEYLSPFLTYYKGSITESDAVKVGTDLCKALLACEQNNIIHRDIKPSNILVSEYGDHKLGDFGVSRTLEHENTYGTQAIGSPDFMSPEVFNGDKYGMEADIYSLGMVLYWMLNGRTLPFLTQGKAPTHRETTEARDKRFGGEKIPSPENGSEALKRIVLKACEFDPHDRYHGAGEMLKDLNALQYGQESSDVSTPVEDEVIYSTADQDSDNSWQDTDKTVGKDYGPVINDYDSSPTVGKTHYVNEQVRDDAFDTKDVLSSLEAERSKLYDIRKTLLREMSEYSNNEEMSKALDQRYRFNEDKIRLCEEQISKLSGNAQSVNNEQNNAKNNKQKQKKKVIKKPIKKEKTSTKPPVTPKVVKKSTPSSNGNKKTVSNTNSLKSGRVEFKCYNTRPIVYETTQNTAYLMGLRENPYICRIKIKTAKTGCKFLASAKFKLADGKWHEVTFNIPPLVDDNQLLKMHSEDGKSYIYVRVVIYYFWLEALAVILAVFLSMFSAAIFVPIGFLLIPLLILGIIFLYKYINKKMIDSYRKQYIKA